MALNPISAIVGAIRGWTSTAHSHKSTVVASMAAQLGTSALRAAIQSQPADPQRGTSLQMITRNYSGVRVTPEIALMVSAVWACVDVISGAISASDWNVYAGVPSGGNQYLLPEDAAQYILNTRWNAEMSAQAAKRALMIGAVGMGNGYAEIERDLAGRVIALWPIRTDRVEPMRDDASGQLFYRVHNDRSSGWVDLDPRNVLHIRGPGVDGLLGDHPLARAVQTVAKAVAIDQFSSAYFGNSTQLGGFITSPGKLDDVAYGRLKAQFEERHGGSANAFRTGILDMGMQFQSVTTDADKAQLIEASQHVIEEIARWFHVPPHKIGHLLRATNNNIEHQGLEFVRDTLRPWRCEIEQEGSYKVFPARGLKRFICVDLDWATDGDFKSRMEAFSIGRGMGVFSANDILRKLGENTIGPEGDLRIVNGAAIPLERVGENYALSASGGDNPTEDSSDAAMARDDRTTIKAWAISVLRRIEARQRHRVDDLARGGKASDAARVQAAADTLKAVPTMSADLLEMLESRWPSASARARFINAARAVIDGSDLAQIASEFFQEMERS